MRKVYVIVPVRIAVKVEDGENVEDILNDTDFEPRHEDSTRIEYIECKDYQIEDSK